MSTVVDSNILISYALTDEPLHAYANQVLASWSATNVDLIAPRLFRAEVTAVMRKAVYQQRIAHEDGRRLLRQILAYPVTFFDDNALLENAYDLAKQFNRPRAYDSQYLALAQRFGSEFWTADEGLYNSVRSSFGKRLPWGENPHLNHPTIWANSIA
jgi:predicted nucleic acid-binding protein